jgi:hypothetical protein
VNVITLRNGHQRTRKYHVDKVTEVLPGTHNQQSNEQLPLDKIIEDVEESPMTHLAHMHASQRKSKVSDRLFSGIF